MLQTKTVIKIDNQNFELDYPNVGQKLEIENYKLAYSLGLYGEMSRNGHKTATELLDIIDAVAYFRALSPAMEKQFNLKDFTKIDFQTSLKLRKAYKEYSDWLVKYEEEMYKNLEDAEGIATKENQ